jgi:DNA primase
MDSVLIDYRALRRQIPMERVLQLIGYRATSRRGSQLRGPCPFQVPAQPDSRDFSVNLSKGVFRCFCCGACGNQLDLWAHLYHQSLYPAAQDLCQRAGISIPTLEPDSAAR